MKRLAIIGLGSSGIQSLSHFLRFLNNEWEVHSISDPLKPILGIGESTNPAFIRAMENGAKFNMYDVLKNADMDATVKYGTYFEKWRKHDFINPLLNTNAAIHLNTFKLVEWALPRFRNIWGDKFVEILGEVQKIKNIENKAVITIDGVDHTYDWVIDCTGAPKDFEDYITFDNPTNYCLVHNIPGDGSDWMHTKHVATQDGWMFGVPLKTRLSYGYLFNDKITDIEVAKSNFSEEIGVPVAELDGIEYKFKSYFARKIVEGRIIKQGNKAVFYEPMYANSLFLYDLINKVGYDLIINGLPQEEANGYFVQNMMASYELICFFYHGGSTYKTPFWDNAKKFASKVVEGSEKFKFVKERMRFHNDNGFFGSIEWGFDEWGLREIDHQLGYNYFKPKNASKWHK